MYAGCVGTKKDPSRVKDRVKEGQCERGGSSNKQQVVRRRRIRCSNETFETRMPVRNGLQVESFRRCLSDQNKSKQCGTDQTLQKCKDRKGKENLGCNVSLDCLSKGEP